MIITLIKTEILAVRALHALGVCCTTNGLIQKRKSGKAKEQ
jgi:hypothetical protein